MESLSYAQRRDQQIRLLDAAEEALTHAGLRPLKRKKGKQILTPTAILTPAWVIGCDDEPKLVLRVKGDLEPHHLGALHLRGLL